MGQKRRPWRLLPLSTTPFLYLSNTTRHIPSSNERWRRSLSRHSLPNTKKHAVGLATGRTRLPPGGRSLHRTPHSSNSRRRGAKGQGRHQTWSVRKCRPAETKRASRRLKTRSTTARTLPGPAKPSASPGTSTRKERAPGEKPEQCPAKSVP